MLNRGYVTFACFIGFVIFGLLNPNSSQPYLVFFSSLFMASKRRHFAYITANRLLRRIPIYSASRSLIDGC
jgi:hypothetical protein